MNDLVQRAIHDPDSGPGIFARIATVWGAIGVTSWADFAAFLGALYTAALLVDFLWRKFIRPFCERQGWLKRKANRRKEDRG